MIDGQSALEAREDLDLHRLGTEQMPLRPQDHTDDDASLEHVDVISGARPLIGSEHRRGESQRPFQLAIVAQALGEARAHQLRERGVRGQL